MVIIFESNTKSKMPNANFKSARRPLPIFHFQGLIILSPDYKVINNYYDIKSMTIKMLIIRNVLENIILYIGSHQIIRLRIYLTKVSHFAWYFTFQIT